MGDAGRFQARYGPRALVVGGSDGIGAAFARALSPRLVERMRAGPAPSAAGGGDAAGPSAAPEARPGGG